MIKNNKYLNDPRVYVLEMSDSRKKQSSCVNLAFVLGISVFQLLAGMVNQDSSRTGWIVFLYLFTYLPLIYAFFGVFTYWEAGTTMSCLQYQHGLMRIRKSLFAVLVMDVIGIAFEIIYMVLHRNGMDFAPELMYLLLHLPHIILVVVYGRYYDRTFASSVKEKNMN